MKWAMLLGIPAGLSGSIALVQADLVPASVWEQLPIVVLFCGVAILVARYFFQDQERWREMLAKERQTSQEMLTQSLQAQRDASIDFLRMMQDSSKDIFAAFSQTQSEAFREVFDEAIRHIADVNQ